jgi:hypothetical protein
MLLQRLIVARYIGPEHPLIDNDKDHDVTLLTSKATPFLQIELHDGKTQISYPSLKKFKEQWTIIEEKKIFKMPAPGKAKKESHTTLTEAGAVIYTELMNSINRFNARSTQTYPDELAYKRPMFEIKLQKIIYDEKTQEQTKLYGAGVLLVEVTQYEKTRAIFSEGVSFATAKELDNVNAYAPKLYLAAFDGFIESALMYILALNPDDPDNVKALKEDTIRKKNESKKKKADLSTAPIK